MPTSQELLAQARTIHEAIRLLRTHGMARQNAACRKGPRAALRQELTAAQMNAVLAIRTLGCVTIKRLASVLGVSNPSASLMVDRLVEMGVLDREQNPEDRRMVKVSVHSSVLPELEAAEREFLDWIIELLVRIGPERAEKWREVYGCLREVLLEDQMPEPEGDR